MRGIFNKKNIVGIGFVSILGTLLHFAYEWSGNNFFVGFFTPVNESVWEHLKLLLFPMLLYGVLRSGWGGQTEEERTGLLTGALFGVFLIPVLFYTYSGVLGYHTVAIDIAIFYLAVIASFLAAGMAEQSPLVQNHRKIVRFLVFLAVILFFAFTVRPPEIGIFRDYV